MKQATFKSMIEGTEEDFKAIDAWETAYGKKIIIENIVAELKKLDVDSPFPISRYQHSLQSATRAYRDDADEELIVAALLHDVGDTLAMNNHAEMAASILRPYVSKKDGLDCRTSWNFSRVLLLAPYRRRQKCP